MSEPGTFPLPGGFQIQDIRDLEQALTAYRGSINIERDRKPARGLEALTCAHAKATAGLIALDHLAQCLEDYQAAQTYDRHRHRTPRLPAYTSEPHNANA